MSRQSTRNKKYALRKIGKVFGSCVVATVITLGGVAIMAPNVTVYASDTEADPGENKIGELSSATEGYQVFVPKGKKYVRNDDVDYEPNAQPKLITEGHNGNSYILKAKPNENLTEDEITDHFDEEGNELENLFTKLYDEDGDGEVDPKYKRADADTINEHAGNEIAGTQFVEPKVSEVNPKYPHRLDSGIYTPDKDDSNHDGKPDGASGEIDSDDSVVESNKPLTVNPDAEENVVTEDGNVVLSKYYRIHVNAGEDANKVDDVYEIGTKPKVVETPIDYPTRYERDDNIPEGEEHVEVAGKAGKTVTTTTYKLNETTGEVTPNEPETVTTDPVTKVVKRGTQPKVVETPIDYPTRYERDDNIPEGEEHVEVAGKAGKTVTTTTYKLNETTGEVTPNEPETVTTDPVTKVVKRGTQPKPGETPETPQPKPEETPETPQPEQPTAPEEAPAQPGQPSDPADQPDLKVAPPTIAIVEEPNKASFEVKAPKKDADTVKIIYPKSDGSGNEVLTLTKQPSGEWTLDKQPENVTLDKKTGTVTIPRESVVNKQKVQARAKHKTSAYTPFVYAALSIEAANPEHPVTLWVDTAGTELKKPVVGKKELAGEIAGYKWLSSRLEEGILTHTFEKVANGTPILPESSTSHPMPPSSSPSTSTPEKPNKAETPAVRTVWRDENGKDLKVPSVDKQEAGEVPGYEFVESHREGDNLIVHVFRTKQAQTPAPKDQTPSPEQAASPAPSKVSEQKGEAVATATSEKTVDSVTSAKTSDKAELPNTGTEANATLASAGIMTLLAGLGLGFFKKKED
ncbi:G5 domain-containing protein [Streptococcus sp. 1453]|uniref:G5 domain-containing protein n=1 Tax=Streptococcus sp. 1453 TaxID=2582661 RepID=UPI001591B14C|nr:G5 domain-containing protein [Streptococcus sp. 1453]